MCYRICIDETIQLPEHSQAWVTGTVKCPDEKLITGLIGPCDEEAQITVEDALVGVHEGHVPLRMINNYDVPLK